MEGEKKFVAVNEKVSPKKNLSYSNPSQDILVQENKTKKSLAQEVRQKSDISEHRSKG